jgi:RNA polymerase sigma factor (sigma-70 family)
MANNVLDRRSPCLGVCSPSPSNACTVMNALLTLRGLYNWCGVMGRLIAIPSGDADDWVHDALKRMLKNPKWFVQAVGTGSDDALERSFRGTFVRALQNKRRDYCRRKHLLPHTGQDQVLASIFDAHAFDSQGIELQEMREICKQLISGLPQKWRNVVWLRLQGFTPQQVATRLDISKDNEKNILHRAVLQLRRSLAVLKDGPRGATGP